MGFGHSEESEKPAPTQSPSDEVAMSLELKEMMD